MIKTINDIENRTNYSESLINVFDNKHSKQINSHKRLDSDNQTLDSFSLNVMNDVSIRIQDDNDQSKDRFSNMTKEEFLESIFGKSLNITEKNISIKERIRRILLSNYMHILIIVLVLIDSLCVTVELIIDLENKGHNHGMQLTEEIFKYLGFSILCIFVIEITLKIIFTFDEFRKSKLEIIDALVVYISFIADIVFMKHESSLVAIVGLIALFRFWRIIRIVNGIILTVETRYETKIEELKNGMNSLIKEIDSLKLDLNKKQTLLEDIKIAYDF